MAAFVGYLIIFVRVKSLSISVLGRRSGVSCHSPATVPVTVKQCFQINLIFRNGEGISFLSIDSSNLDSGVIIMAFPVLTTLRAVLQRKSGITGVGLCLFLLLAGGIPDARSAVSNNVPLDHWSYGYLDKLEGFGLLPSQMNGIRPYTRMEMARLVNEALRNKEERSLKLPPLMDYFLERLQGEFREELTVYGRGKADPPAAVVLKPIEEAQARYVYVNGEPRQFLNWKQGVAQFPGSVSRIIATEGTGGLYNNNGIVYGSGSNFSLQFASSITVYDLFSGYLEPLVVLRQNDSEGGNLNTLTGGWTQGRLNSFGNADVDLLLGYAKFSPWNVEIEFGRDSMWWGQGAHGSLIMSNNAAPLDMLKISNPSTTILPWFFSYLGPFKYTFFCGQLQDYLLPENALLGGGTILFKPLPWLELGYATTFMFNGSGVPGLGGFDYFKLITGIGFGQKNNVDQLGEYELRITLPFMWNAQLYLEYGGEDSGGTEYPEEWFGLGDIAYLAGIYFPRITPDGTTDFRFEFAKTATRVDSTPGFWYGHTRYRSGYTNAQMIMGHFIGPDAQDFFARISHYLRPDLCLGLDFDHSDQGLTLSAIEEHNNSVGADVTYDITQRWRVTTRYVFETIENFNQVRSNDRDNHLLMTTLKFYF